MRSFFLTLLSLAMAGTLSAQSTGPCTELFFSEFVEGSQCNKAIEIYNPTDQAIDLSAYSVKRYRNGSNSAPADEVFQLSGSVGPLSIVTLVNGDNGQSGVPGACTQPADAALLGVAILTDNTYPGPLFMNGDDAITLEKNIGGTDQYIDIMGKIGEAPSAGAWVAEPPHNAQGTWITKEQTMIRKASVRQGVSTNPSLFNPLAEYDTLSRNDFSDFGSHTCDCGNATVSNDRAVFGSQVKVYPTPATEAGFVLVDAPSRLVAARLLNINGQLAARLEVGTPAQGLRLELPAGLRGFYLLQVEAEDGQMATKKLIIR